MSSMQPALEELRRGQAEVLRLVRESSLGPPVAAANFPALKVALQRGREGFELAVAWGADQSAQFYAEALPPLLHILTSITTPQGHPNVENDLRVLALDLLMRIPCHDAQRPLTFSTLECLTQVILTDHEDNCLVALKRLLDTHKHFKCVEAEAYLPPFFDFVRTMYHEFQYIVDFHFGGGPAEGGQQGFVVGRRSLKLLVDFPQCVVGLCGQYPAAAPPLLPPLFAAVSAAFRSRIPPGPAQPQQRLLYADLVAAMAKAISFLMYGMRSFPEYVQEYKKDIPSFIKELLLRCSPECLVFRRDLLMMLRTISETDLRERVVDHLEPLLSERALLGEDPATADFIRPTAFSAIMDVILHVRHRLSTEQVGHVIAFLTAALASDAVGLHLQGQCIRVLLHTVELVFKTVQAPTPGPPGGAEAGAGVLRPLFVRLLQVLVGRLEALRAVLPACPPPEASVLREAEEGPMAVLPAVASVLERKTDADQGREARVVLRLLLSVTKNVVYLLTTLPPMGAGDGGPRRLAAVELKLLHRLFAAGLGVFALGGGKDGPEAALAEEREQMESFASAFNHLDPQTFGDVLGHHLPALYRCLVAHPHCHAITAHLIGFNPVSKTFCNLLLGFLVRRMDRLADMGPEGAIEGATQLRLFQLVFSSMRSYVQPVDSVKAFFPTIVSHCLKFSRGARDPTPYLQVLAGLYRASTTCKGSGGSEVLGADDCLYTLVDRIITVQRQPLPTSVHEHYVDLCLRLPTKGIGNLSGPFLRSTYLPVLLRNILTGLRSSNGELVATALRMFEPWLENMRPELLETILSQQPGLLDTVCLHLQPKPQPYGAAAMRILAKLGGKNRKLPPSPDLVPCHATPAPGLRVTITFGAHPSPQVPESATDEEQDPCATLPLQQFLPEWEAVIDAADSPMAGAAYRCVKACLLPFLGLVDDAPPALPTAPHAAPSPAPDAGTGEPCMYPTAMPDTELEPFLLSNPSWADGPTLCGVAFAPPAAEAGPRPP
eukprot:EG_transcript_1971